MSSALFGSRKISSLNSHRVIPRPRHLPRAILLTTILALVSVGGAILASSGGSKDADSIPVLKERIKELELEVERQELIINALRTQLKQLHRNAQLRQRLLPEELPRGARPFEFEGMQFYVIPVQGDQQGRE